MFFNQSIVRQKVEENITYILPSFLFCSTTGSSRGKKEQLKREQKKRNEAGRAVGLRVERCLDTLPEPLHAN